MLEVKILLSDLDYDGVADLVVPLVSDRLAAKGGLIGKIAGKKEELLKAVHKFYLRRIRMRGISFWLSWLPKSAV